VQRVLQAATAENDNPDVRDRAYVYWRLLSNTTNPGAPKNIVLSEKPPILTTVQSLPPTLLEQLLNELSTLASVYHKPPEQFVGQGRFGADAVQRAAIEYVFLALGFIYKVTNMYQGTNPECTRESLGSSSGCRCGHRYYAPAPSTRQRRKPAGYRLRWWGARICTERTREWLVWP